MISNDETLGFRSFYEKLYAEPDGDNLLMCGPGFYTVGFTPEALQACHTVIEQVQKSGSRWDEDNTKHLLTILSFAAMQTRDIPLAEAVSDFCVEKARELSDDGFTLEIVCRLLECASANSNHAEAMEALALRLEAVAFLTPRSTLFDLYDTLRRLQVLDATLSCRLGRAIAAARLGRKRADF